MEAFIDNASGLIDLAFTLVKNFFESFVLAGNAVLDSLTFATSFTAVAFPVLGASISCTLLVGLVKILLGR